MRRSPGWDWPRRRVGSPGSERAKPVPFETELEVLVGVETGLIDDELCHAGIVDLFGRA